MIKEENLKIAQGLVDALCICLVKDSWTDWDREDKINWEKANEIRHSLGGKINGADLFHSLRAMERQECKMTKTFYRLTIKGCETIELQGTLNEIIKYFLESDKNIWEFNDYYDIYKIEYKEELYSEFDFFADVNSYSLKKKAILK
jgi:hypothetical protein